MHEGVGYPTFCWEFRAADIGSTCDVTSPVAEINTHGWEEGNIAPEATPKNPDPAR